LTDQLRSLLLVLVLENSAYLVVRVMEQNNCRRIGPLFGDTPVPQIEHEHEHDDEDEHDSAHFGIWVKDL
jgi:hypothetical protein